MRVAHPRANDDGAGPPPNYVDVDGRHVPVDDDGCFEVDDEYWLQDFADAHDCDADDLRVDEDEDQGAETCDAELSSGGVCGRDLPCPYHSESGGDD